MIFMYWLQEGPGRHRFRLGGHEHQPVTDSGRLSHAGQEASELIMGIGLGGQLYRCAPSGACTRDWSATSGSRMRRFGLSTHV